jgi:hypothetical protein
MKRLGLVLLLCGCPQQLRPDPNPPNPPKVYPACTTESWLSDDVCDGYFVDDGMPCVECKGGPGRCQQEETQVYCVFGSCLTDGECHKRQDMLKRR